MEVTLTFGSLFAGIGGFDLGFERAGLVCKWQVEMDDYAQKVLAKHWPGVPRYSYVQGFLGGKRWRRVRAAWYVDVICGGFPCQDISNAGKRAGIDGERSGLWSEFARVIRLLRPRYVVVENVPALTIRGLGRVLGDLAALGFDAEWGCIPAAAVGAPHPRWRLFLTAYRRPGPLDVLGYGSDANGDEHENSSLAKQEDWAPAANGRSAPDSDGLRQTQQERCDRKKRRRTIDICQGHASDSDSSRLKVPQQIPEGKRHADESREAIPPDAIGSRRGARGNKSAAIYEDNSPDAASRWAGQRWRHELAAHCERTGRLFWPDAEPGVCRSLDGFSGWLDRSNLIEETHHAACTIADEQNLLALWGHIREAALQRASGGSHGISEEEVLLAFLRQLEAFGDQQIRISLARPEIAQEAMRGVRLDKTASRPPHRSEREEQRIWQHSDTMQALSSLVAQNSRKAWTAYRGTDASVAAGFDGITGVATGVPKRMDRLKCLGNSVIPQLAEWIAKRISGRNE